MLKVRLSKEKKTPFDDFKECSVTLQGCYEVNTSTVPLLQKALKLQSSAQLSLILKWFDSQQFVALGAYSTRRESALRELTLKTCEGGTRLKLRISIVIRFFDKPKEVIERIKELITNLTGGVDKQTTSTKCTNQEETTNELRAETINEESKRQ